MNIPALLSTKERTRILNSVIYKTEQISVNKTAKDIKISKGLVSKYLNILTREGILKREGSKFSVQNSIKTKTLRLMLNLNLFDKEFFKKYKFVKGAGIYGSFAKGTNTEKSDIDMWIAVDNASEEKLAKLTNELKRAFGDAKPIYLTNEKIQLLRKKDVTFYHALVFGSITIYGDELEAV